MQSLRYTVYLVPINLKLAVLLPALMASPNRAYRSFALKKLLCRHLHATVPCWLLTKHKIVEAV